jgi:hypothetical protein
MAEDNEPSEPARKIAPDHYEFTRDQVERFFVEKWKILRCEVCKETVWSYDVLHSPYNIIPVSDGKELSILSDKVNVFVRVSCRSCGNSKFLLAPIIHRWLEDNK